MRAPSSKPRDRTPSSRPSDATACVIANPWWKWWTPTDTQHFTATSHLRPPHALSASTSVRHGFAPIHAMSNSSTGLSRQTEAHRAGKLRRDRSAEIDDYLARDGYAPWRLADILRPRSHRRDLRFRTSRTRRRRLPHRTQMDSRSCQQRTPSNTSSATATRAIPEPSWTGWYWNPIRIVCWKVWPSRLTRLAPAKVTSYIRAEYPQAVRHTREAIRQAQERGLLGTLRLEVREGAGAFVCGEETALIQSLEGKRGMPKLRPPYPVNEAFAEADRHQQCRDAGLRPVDPASRCGAFAAFGTRTAAEPRSLRWPEKLIGAVPIRLIDTMAFSKSAAPISRKCRGSIGTTVSIPMSRNCRTCPRICHSHTRAVREHGPNAYALPARSKGVAAHRWFVTHCDFLMSNSQ